MQHRKRPACEEAELGFQLVGLARIVCEQQQRRVGLSRQFCKRERRARADQAAPARMTAGRQRLRNKVSGFGHDGHIGKRARDYSRAA